MRTLKLAFFTFFSIFYSELDPLTGDVNALQTLEIRRKSRL